MFRKTGYDYLKEMILVKSESSDDISNNPKTSRVEYIISELKKIGVQIIEDEFSVSVGGHYKRMNIYVPFYCNDRKKKSTLTFTAHHDIVNPNSQNCQDNTASVCNLLHLCRLLKDREPNQNIVVAFLDGEEVGLLGSRRMAQKMKMNHLPFVNSKMNINLELTGAGKNIWADFKNFNLDTNLKIEIEKTITDVKPTSSPRNDSFMFRKYGIDSVCIGLWNDIDLEQSNNKIFPNTWRLCHVEHDTIDKISESDMNEFVENHLVKLAL